uniref:Uncharacterized protein n=1 Tax=Romanomermis culicivorax TaxID=13658 RepID=A0A915IJ03_ROMCU
MEMKENDIYHRKDGHPGAAWSDIFYLQAQRCTIEFYCYARWLLDCRDGINEIKSCQWPVFEALDDANRMGLMAGEPPKRILLTIQENRPNPVDSEEDRAAKRFVWTSTYRNMNNRSTR